MDWNLILGIASAVQTVAIAYVGMKTAKIDKLQDQLETKAGEIIDARMQVLESRLQISIRSLEQIVKIMSSRLESGDEHFKAVDQKNHTLEIKVMQQVMTLTRELATKDDLKELQRTISEMQIRLARHVPSNN